MDDATLWLQTLRQFAAQRRGELVLPNGHELNVLDDWKRRVSGGVLLQFLEFLQNGAAHEHFNVALERFPLFERVFVFITDLPGAVAGQDLLRQDSDRAICLLKSEWTSWLSQDDTDHDEFFLNHYEFWSVWHQDTRSDWEIEMLEGAEYWVHEEGFALAPQAGRGAQHLWKWDGESMVKVEEAITSWRSTPEVDTYS